MWQNFVYFEDAFNEESKCQYGMLYVEIHIKYDKTWASQYGM